MNNQLDLCFPGFFRLLTLIQEDDYELSTRLNVNQLLNKHESIYRAPQRYLSMKLEGAVFLNIQEFF